jgi:hypothetical protein
MATSDSTTGSPGAQRFYVGMVVVFSFVFSGMVISKDQEYGDIGIIFAFMSYLIAVGVLVILGAVAGLLWQDRRGQDLPLDAGNVEPAR